MFVHYLGHPRRLVGQIGHLVTPDNPIRARLVSRNGDRIFFTFTFETDVYTALYECAGEAEPEMEALLESLRAICPHIVEKQGWTE